MNKSLTVTLVGCLAAILTGCASGSKFSEYKSSIPALAGENGRIFFYRTAVVGMAVQPAVKLNHEEVGTAKPKGFFFVDRPAGNYEVETTTEVSRKLSLTLDKGQSRYVRLNMAMGFFAGHVYPELIKNATGENEITKCKYTGAH